MVHCITKHDQGHGGLGDGVVFFQVVLHGLGQKGHIRNLIIDLFLSLWMHEVAKAEGFEVVIRHHRRPSHDVWEKDLAQVDLYITIA